MEKCQEEKSKLDNELELLKRNFDDVQRKLEMLTQNAKA